MDDIAKTHERKFPSLGKTASAVFEAYVRDKLAGSAESHELDASTDEVLATAERLAELEQVIEHRLGEGDRRYWRELSVFSGPFTLNASAEVWRVELGRARALLELFRQNRVLDLDASGERYTLDGLLAAYGLAQLASDELMEARLRHASFYVEALRAADRGYVAGGTEILHALQMLDADWRDMRAAQAWASANAHHIAEAQELCALFGVWEGDGPSLRLSPRELVTWLEASLQAFSQGARESDPYGRCMALGNVASAHADLGEYRKAIEIFQQQRDLAREEQDRIDEAMAWGGLADCYAAVGNIDGSNAAVGDMYRSKQCSDEQALIAQRNDDRRGFGRAVANRGKFEVGLRDWRRAVLAFRQAANVAREIGQKRDEADALGLLGHAYVLSGEPRKVIRLHTKRLQIAGELGDQRGLCDGFLGLGEACLALHEARNASRFLARALEIAREAGYPPFEARTLKALGFASQALGETAPAREFWQAAYPMLIAMESPEAEIGAQLLAKL